MTAYRGAQAKVRAKHCDHAGKAQLPRLLRLFALKLVHSSGCGVSREFRGYAQLSGQRVHLPPGIGPHHGDVRGFVSAAELFAHLVQLGQALGVLIALHAGAQGPRDRREHLRRQFQRAAEQSRIVCAAGLAPQSRAQPGQCQQRQAHPLRLAEQCEVALALHGMGGAKSRQRAARRQNGIGRRRRLGGASVTLRGPRQAGVQAASARRLGIEASHRPQRSGEQSLQDAAGQNQEAG